MESIRLFYLNTCTVVAVVFFQEISNREKSGLVEFRFPLRIVLLALDSSVMLRKVRFGMDFGPLVQNYVHLPNSALWPHSFTLLE